MYHFEYVNRSKWKPVKKQLIELIKHVQDEVRKDFTFRYDFVGSSKRNMITNDIKSNVGFDFDINIEVNGDDEKYSAREIKEKLMNSFNRVIRKYCEKLHYKCCENNTRVFTIKVIDHKNSKILHSCDFAIVYNCSDGSQQYIRYNKSQNNYSWTYQTKAFSNLNERAKSIKKSGLWNNVKDLYLIKKNANTDIHKKSCSIYAETINEIYKKL